MKIAILSDIHLEFYIGKNKPMPTIETVAADILVLAGDIISCHCIDDQMVIDFLWSVSLQYKRVYYVLGNHEHYGGDINTTKARIQEIIDNNNITNIILLEKDIDKYQDVVFYGATLWTNPKLPFFIERSMNDYFQITDSPPNNLKISRTIWEYERTVNKLYNYLTLGYGTFKKFVVITHTAPTSLSTPARYKGNNLEDGYVNNLGNFIIDNPEIVLWVHGHIHDAAEYEVGSAKVICNPVGYYGSEHKLNTLTPKVVEI